MCDCIEKINTQLKAEGYTLNASLGFSGPRRAMIGLIRTDRHVLESRRGKPSSMVASHCPWCGEKYPDAEARETGPEGAS